MEPNRNVTSSPAGTLLLRRSNDVVTCRQVVGQLAGELNYSKIGKTMLVTAASELARNVLLHGGGGEVFWTVLGEGDHAGVGLVLQDNGPGIRDLKLAMTDG